MKSAAELEKFVESFSKIMRIESDIREYLDDTPQLLSTFTAKIQQIVDGKSGYIGEISSEDNPTFTLEELKWLRYFYEQRNKLEPGVLWTSVNSLLPKTANQ